MPAGDELIPMLRPVPDLGARHAGDRSQKKTKHLVSILSLAAALPETPGISNDV